MVCLDQSIIANPYYRESYKKKGLLVNNFSFNIIRLKRSSRMLGLMYKI